MKIFGKQSLVGVVAETARTEHDACGHFREPEPEIFSNINLNKEKRGGFSGYGQRANQPIVSRFYGPSQPRRGCQDLGASTH
jgi:hypothetical protein